MMAIAPNTLELFNGTITVKNTETGTHRTFSIKTKDFSKDPKKEDLKRVIYLLAGPDWFTPFGFVNKDGSISVWRKHRGTNGERSKFETYARFLTKNLHRFEEAGKIDVVSEERCRRCNRPLTHPDSITGGAHPGIGPICNEKGDF